ncbi:hypothetical protein V8E36_002346 [Tilletia maclaganii]
MPSSALRVFLQLFFKIRATAHGVSAASGDFGIAVVAAPVLNIVRILGRVLTSGSSVAFPSCSLIIIVISDRLRQSDPISRGPCRSWSPRLSSSPFLLT